MEEISQLIVLCWIETTSHHSGHCSLPIVFCSFISHLIGYQWTNKHSRHFLWHSRGRLQLKVLDTLKAQNWRSTLLLSEKDIHLILSPSTGSTCEIKSSHNCIKAYIYMQLAIYRLYELAFLTKLIIQLLWDEIYWISWLQSCRVNGDNLSLIILTSGFSRNYQTLHLLRSVPFFPGSISQTRQ